MPITDYRAADALAVVSAIGLTGRLRAYWSRLFNRGPDSVEGHRVRD